MYKIQTCPEFLIPCVSSKIYHTKVYYEILVEVRNKRRAQVRKERTEGWKEEITQKVLRRQGHRNRGRIQVWQGTQRGPGQDSIP